MNRIDLARKTKKKSGVNITNADAQKFFDAFIDVIEEAVIKGEKVIIRNFGTFYSFKKRSCKKYNIRTGERYMTDPKTLPYFRAMPAFKKLVLEAEKKGE